MSEIYIDSLKKSYGSNVAVDDISFTVNEGELTSLIGPSGCGKTTTLRCVAGLERPDRGTIKIGDEVVTDPARDKFVPPHERNIGFVFQTFDVWPHFTVYENVAYPLENRDYPESEIENRVTEVLELAGIEELRDKQATQLSGGQQARVGICRAIVYEPRVLLFDEPLTGLDRNLRKSMRYEIKQIQSELEITSLYVTHSQPEAMTLSDHICLLNENGRIEQEGTSWDLYNDPETATAFDFFGSSETIDGTVSGPDEIETSIGTVTADVHWFENPEEVEVRFRSEKVELALDRQSGWAENVFVGTVDDVSFLGEMYEVSARLNGRMLRSHQQSIPDELTEGDEVFLHIDPEDVFIYEVS